MRSSSSDPRGRPVDKPVVHISVPKRVVRLATDRNRIKRLVREALRASDPFRDKRIYRLVVTASPLPATLDDAKRALAKAAGS